MNFPRLIFLLPVLLFGCKEHNRTAAESDFDEDCRQLVLKQNKIQQVYSFGEKGEGINECDICYLGTIKMKDGRTIKLINCVAYTGLYEDSRRANGKVFLYDATDKLIGHYYVGGVNDIPSRIEGSKLIFSRNDEHCNLRTEIDLRDSIPRQIFVHCTQDGGNIYTFDTE